MLSDIVNFVPIDERVATGGQPNEEQLAELATHGFEVVINLGLLDPRYRLEDEEGTVRRLGMAYRHIPIQFAQPSPGDLRDFVAAMDEHAGQRVFVHCALNYRVSAMVALYGQVRWDWSEWRADEFIHDIWTPDEVWTTFVRRARAAIQPRDEAPYDEPDAPPPQAATPSSAQVTDDSDVRNPIARIYRGLWNGRDATAAEVLAQDVVFRTALGQESRGRDALLAHIAETRTAVGNLRCTIKDLVCEGDKGFARVQFSGVQQGELLGFPASGKPVAWSAAALLRFHNGQLVQLWELGDLHGLFQQLARYLE